MAEREKRPEAVGPVWMLKAVGAEVVAQGHAIVTVAEYVDIHGVDVVVVIPCLLYT
jgi:hypothetical protein